MEFKNDKPIILGLLKSCADWDGFCFNLNGKSCKELLSYIDELEFRYNKIKELHDKRQFILQSMYGRYDDNLRLIDILNGISCGYYDAPLYFRINMWGYNFVIKYLRYEFIIEDVKTGYNKCVFKKGDDFEVPLSALNNKVFIIEEGECYEY